MLVRMTQRAAGLYPDRPYGIDLDLTPAEAAQLIARGHAEPVRRDEPERAVDRRQREKAVR